MYEAKRKQGTGTDRELMEVLAAISVVSGRLAVKLAMMQNQSTEGGSKDARYGHDHRETAYCCCHY